MKNLHDRAKATRLTMARYQGKAFNWASGITCVHLARFHLKNMDHKPPTIPRFRSALGARKALKERGWNNVVDMLDDLLPRIAPAFLLTGDIVATESEDGLSALFIYTGNRGMWGWAQEGPAKPGPAVDVNLDKLAGAWRV